MVAHGREVWFTAIKFGLSHSIVAVILPANSGS